MSAGSTAYLVTRRDDGFGDVFPLTPGQTCTMGRAPTNRIVLKDDLCSREHAEITCTDGTWHIRDLSSLNGTRVNDVRLDASEWELEPNDQIHLGRTVLMFVNTIDQLPDMPAPPPEQTGGLSIRKRLRQTRFLTPLPASSGGAETADPTRQQSLSRELSLLYRLALDMGTAETSEELCQTVLDSLFEATPAEIGAILLTPETVQARPAAAARTVHVKTLHSVDLEVVATRKRVDNDQPYMHVSEFVSDEVLSTRESILAENVAGDRHLRSRESLSDLNATSLICAPIQQDKQILGLIHLYSTSPEQVLGNEDLEFVVAVAKQLGIVLYQLRRQQSLSAANRSLRDQLHVESELTGESPAVREIETQISRVAGTNATCLIRGESGVGKELVARAVHYSSNRKEGPFVCLNCAALTETLLESELFGHEKGSFTGATERKIGKFEAAHQGTIFLDEIGEMNVGTQAKLLRILEGHPFERVGGSSAIQVDVRVVAATNQPLEQSVARGAFRRDLFFRLQVVEIHVPPLRERKSDIRLLTEHFLARFVRETGRKIHGFTPAAMKKLDEYNWPGNVRELRNVVERAVALGTGPTLDASDVWLSSLEVPGISSGARNDGEYRELSLEEVEKQHILRTLSHTDWNKSHAANILGIERSTLDRKIKAYGLKR